MFNLHIVKFTFLIYNSSMSFDKGVKLYNYHSEQLTRQFHHPEYSLVVLFYNHPFPHPKTWHLSSFLTIYSFAFSRMSYKWNHEIQSLWRLATFPYYNVLEICAYCCLYQFVPIYCWVILPCMDSLQSFFLLLAEGHLGYF